MCYEFLYENGVNETKISQISFRARVISDGRPQDAYVYFSPLILKPGKMGWDVNGSPNWGPGSQSWQPGYNPIFYSRNAQPVNAEQAKGYFRSGFSLTDLEVIKISLIEKQGEPANTPPPTWLRQVFQAPIPQNTTYDNLIRQGQRQTGVVDYGFGTSFFAKSNVSSLEYSSDDESWTDTAEQYVYHKLNYVLQGAFGEEQKLHRLKVEFVWETQYPGTPQKRIVTVTKNITLKEGELFCIADRMPLSVVKEFGLEAYLIVTSDQVSQEEETQQMEDDNPFAEIAKVEAKQVAERSRKAEEDRRAALEKEHMEIALAEKKRLEAERLAKLAPKPELLIAPFDKDDIDQSQKAWSKYLRQPVSRVDSIGTKLVLIPAGEAKLGSYECDTLRGCYVRITKPYYIGETEVTNSQFRTFLEDTGRERLYEHWTLEYHDWDDNKQKPVLADWKNVYAYLRWLSAKENVKYRLPTEAEWEYACRGGTQRKRHCLEDGDSTWDLDKHANLLYEASDGYEHLAPVANYLPNNFGLFDMLGNVDELCSDHWSSASKKRTSPEDVLIDPSYLGESPAEDAYVTKGANWRTERDEAFDWSRVNCNFNSSGGLGFRVVREIPNASPGDEKLQAKLTHSSKETIKKKSSSATVTKEKPAPEPNNTPAESTGRQRYKDNVVYVCAKRTIRFKANSKLSEEDSRYLTKNQYKLFEAFSPIYKVELPDDIEWDKISGPTHSYKIFLGWASTFGDDNDIPERMRDSLYFDKTYDNFPTQAMAERYLENIRSRPEYRIIEHVTVKTDGLYRD